jgi:hypothetical protein
VPRVSSAQVAVTAPAARRGWLLPVVLVALASVLALRFGPALLERVRHPSAPIDHTTGLPHLGVHVSLPDGWRHARGGDRAPVTTAAGFEILLPDPLSARRSRFFRGPGGDPDAELLLSVAARPPEVGMEELREWASGAAAAPQALVETVRELSGVTTLELARCVAGPAIPGGGLRCVGNAGRRRAVVHFFGAGAATAVTVFLSTASPDTALREADALVAGLDLRR